MILSNSPPHNKEEKVETFTWFPLSSLPDELVLSCLARVSRSDYTSLSLLSKKYHSLVVSPELYKMRLRLGCREVCMFVCLSPYKSNRLWFILSRENSRNWVISRISSFPYVKKFSMVASDWGIYVIGGWRKGKSTSDVLFLDCRTNTWRKLPSMSVARSSPAVGVVEGKIYVFGGCEDIGSSNYGEVFDIKTQTWNTLVPMPDLNIRVKWTHVSFVIDEKVYTVGEVKAQSLCYSPNEGKWRRSNLDSAEHPLLTYNCVIIEKLIYSCDYSGKFFWCEKDEKLNWKEVKGLDFCLLGGFRRLSNFGENIAVFWCMNDYHGNSSEIWCAEISLARAKEGDEVWGKVEWSSALNTLDCHVPHGLKVLYSVSINL